ncbi:MAG: hypothetical protein MI742_04375 [Desulfobacterales bacterium]|nr:hypothetical protein [Desulfobacterales bacterium]
MKAGPFSGAIVGFSNEQLLDKRMAPHDYIAHWAYLPKPRLFPSDVWQTVIWSHSQTFTLSDFLQPDYGFLPKYLLMFSR